MLTDSSWVCSLPGLEFATISFEIRLLWALSLALKIIFFQDSHHLHSQVVFPCWSELNSEILSFCHPSYLLRGDVVGKENPEFLKLSL